MAETTGFQMSGPENNEQAWQIISEDNIRLNLAGEGEHSLVWHAVKKQHIEAALAESTHPEKVADYTALRQKVFVIKESKDFQEARDQMGREMVFATNIYTLLKNYDTYNLSRHFLSPFSKTRLEGGNPAYFCMDTVPSGLTLSHLRHTAIKRSTPVPDQLVFRFLTQFLDIFRFLQQTCGMVHRDLRHSKFMISHDAKCGPCIPDLILIDCARIEQIDKSGELAKSPNEGEFGEEKNKLFQLILDLIADGHMCRAADNTRIDHSTTLCLDEAHTERWRSLQKTLIEKQRSLDDLRFCYWHCGMCLDEIVNDPGVRARVEGFLESAIADLEEENRGQLIPDEALEEAVRGFLEEKEKSPEGMEDLNEEIEG